MRSRCLELLRRLSRTARNLQPGLRNRSLTISDAHLQDVRITRMVEESVSYAAKISKLEKDEQYASMCQRETEYSSPAQRKTDWTRMS